MLLRLQRDTVDPGDRGASISPPRSRRRLTTITTAGAGQHCLERGRLPSLMTIEVAGDQARGGQPMLLGDPERGSAGGQLLKRQGTPRPPGRVERRSQDRLGGGIGTHDTDSPRTGPVVETGDRLHRRLPAERGGCPRQQRLGRVSHRSNVTCDPRRTAIAAVACIRNRDSGVLGPLWTHQNAHVRRASGAGPIVGGTAAEPLLLGDRERLPEREVLRVATRTSALAEHDSGFYGQTSQRAGDGTATSISNNTPVAPSAARLRGPAAGRSGQGGPGSTGTNLIVATARPGPNSPPAPMPRYSRPPLSVASHGPCSRGSSLPRPLRISS